MVKVPDKLKPGANESLAMIAHAKGVQIYECRAKKDQAGRLRMGIRGSRSRSFRRGRKQDRPTLCRPALGIDRWQQAHGYGEGTCRRASADSVPWLLLTTKSVRSEGSFSKVTSVQRVSTVGGVAPKVGCSQAAAGTHASTTRRTITSSSPSKRASCSDSRETGAACGPHRPPQGKQRSRRPLQPLLSNLHVLRGCSVQAAE